jgi:predicted  nucleic acid-binding Zn-ribbon protein
MALKASPDDQALLLDLQALDTKLQQLAHRAKSVPEIAVLQQLAAESAAIILTQAEQSGALDDAQLELTRIESDVAVVEARIARDRERLQTSSSVKDVAAFEQEIASLHKRQLDLEEIELTVMERVEAQNAVVAATAVQLTAITEKVTEAEVARDAALKEIDAERNNAAANRSTIAAKVPADLLALYEKQRERYGSGASLLRGGVSLAAGLALNANDMVVIRSAAPDDVLLCPESSAILVRTNESGL